MIVSMQRRALQDFMIVLTAEGNVESNSPESMVLD